MMAKPFVAWLLVACCAAPLSACPFCARMGKTLAENLAEADVVVHGRLSKARVAESNAAAGGASSGGNTELQVDRVLKSVIPLELGTRVRLARFVAVARDKPVARLVFADVVGDDLDPYRLISVEPAAVEYLAGVAVRADAKVPDRLRYAFAFLGDRDSWIAEDAYKEFAKATFADVMAAASVYDSRRLRQWLADPATPAYRVGLLGLLLGTTPGATPDDARFLRGLLDQPATTLVAGWDGILAGYCLLEPASGHDRVVRLLTDANIPLARRYAGLECTRFLLNDAPKKERARLLLALEKAIGVAELTDLAMDELRKQNAWSALPTVLHAAESSASEGGKVPREAVARFVLRCPDPIAKEYLRQVRAVAPALVLQAEQNLRFEDDARDRTKSAKRRR